MATHQVPMVDILLLPMAMEVIMGTMGIIEAMEVEVVAVAVRDVAEE